MSARTLLGPLDDIAQNLIPTATTKWRTVPKQSLPNAGQPLDYWCAPSGTDTSTTPGSAQSPWRTIPYAITRIASLAQFVGGPFTLHLYNGVYGTPGTPIVIDVPNLTIMRDATSSAGSVTIDAHVRVDIPPPVAGVASWSLSFSGITFSHGFQYGGTPTNVITQAISFDTCVFQDEGTAVYPATANALVSLGHTLPSPTTGTPPTMVVSINNCSFNKPLDNLNKFRRSLWVGQPSVNSRGVQGCVFQHNGNGAAVYIQGLDTLVGSGVIGFPVMAAEISVNGFDNTAPLGTEGIVAWKYNQTLNSGGYSGPIGYDASLPASSGTCFDFRPCLAPQGDPVPGVPSFWIFNNVTFALGTPASAASYGEAVFPVAIGFFQNITSTPVIGDWGSNITIQYSAAHGLQPSPSASLWDVPPSQWAVRDPPRQFFVAVNGVDADSIPGSATAPWKTIEYAHTRLLTLQAAFPGGYSISLGPGTYDAPSEPLTMASLAITADSANALTTLAPVINGTLVWDLSGTTLQGGPTLTASVSNLNLTGGVIVKGGPANVNMPFSFYANYCLCYDGTWTASPNTAYFDVGQGFPNSSREASWTNPQGDAFTYQSYSSVKNCVFNLKTANLRHLLSKTYAVNFSANTINGYAAMGALAYWDDSAGGAAPTDPGYITYDGNVFDAQGVATPGATDGLIVVKVNYATSAGTLSAHNAPLRFDGVGTGWTILDFRPSTAVVAPANWTIKDGVFISGGAPGFDIGNANAPTPAGISTQNNQVSGSWAAGPNVALTPITPAF